jgi:hypothetical protein
MRILRQKRGRRHRRIGSIAMRLPCAGHAIAMRFAQLLTGPKRPRLMIVVKKDEND